MTDQKTIRISQAAKRLNVGRTTIVDFLKSKNIDVDKSPNAKILVEHFALLEREYEDSKALKEEASELQIGVTQAPSAPKQEKAAPAPKAENKPVDPFADAPKQKEAPAEIKAAPEVKPAEKAPAKEAAPVKEQPKAEEPKAPKAEATAKAKDAPITEATTEATEKPKTEAEKPAAKEPEQPADPRKLQGTKVVGKIDLDELKKRSSRTKPAKKRQEPKGQASAALNKAEPKAQTPKAADTKITSPKGSAPVGSPAPKVNTPTGPAKPAAAKADAVKTPAKATAENAAASAEGATEGEDTKSTMKAEADKLKGLKVVGKIQLTGDYGRGRKKSKSDPKGKDGKRKRISKPSESRVRFDGTQNKPAAGSAPSGANTGGGGGSAGGRGPNKKAGGGSGSGNNRSTPSPTDVGQQFRRTMGRMAGGAGGGRKGSKSKYRREKREARAAQSEALREQELQDASTLKVTEFISVADLASLMDENVNEVIATAMQVGMFVSINQRLDSESITMLADEFGFDVDFTTAEDEVDSILDEEDKPEDLKDRAPVVTIMGHVDHGKTSLLDYIRKANVASGEAGGITQHIGAYDVETASGKRIAFLDTPGHEAFTAMRARGAKLTDVAIIVIAADDSVMPQTKEAINHAQVAGVPLVFAINKIDKAGANSHKIKEELAGMNILVEDWGGKYQCYEISAKNGIGIEELLEGVVLEADVMELKANPDKNAVGAVVEAELDKGRGYVTTVLVQSGTLRVGDIILAGQHYGRVRAMMDHRGNRLKEAGPSTPVAILGLSGAPQAGDKLNVMNSERDAREIAGKREQIMREQSVRATRRTTLSDIGRRIEIGNFQQLNIILKGDVDGSVEALSDSLLKLSTEEVEVNIIQKAVGPISEGDVLLASASEAIILGFQVRPTPSARKLAERDDVEIRLYSVIYNAIDEVKLAMEGLLAPKVEEIIVGNAEVRETFRISRSGTIAGCYVTDGYIKRNSKIRLIREGIVVYGGGTKSGEIQALKRFKDDVTEVKQGFECGISIQNFNDIKVGDVIEAFEERELKRTL